MFHPSIGLFKVYPEIDWDKHFHAKIVALRQRLFSTQDFNPSDTFKKKNRNYFIHFQCKFHFIIVNEWWDGESYIKNIHRSSSIFISYQVIYFRLLKFFCFISSRTWSDPYSLRLVYLWKRTFRVKLHKPLTNLFTGNR